MRRPQTILVVEDDSDLRRLYRTALTVAGYTVREASDGLDALRMIDAEPPALVILDLGLPLISGETVLQEIAARAHTRQIPIVIVTGSTDSVEFDVACVLRKPATHDEVVDAVRRCLISGAGSIGV